jgi:hypothetical protein
MTFVHCFSRRVRVTIQVADEPPADGNLRIDAQWTERPSRKFVREYIRFACEVSRLLAAKWDLKLAYVVQVTPGTWEFWCFEPGAAPVLAEVIRS